MLLRELSELLAVFCETDAVHETVTAFALHDAFDVVPLEARAKHADGEVRRRAERGDVKSEGDFDRALSAGVAE